MTTLKFITGTDSTSSSKAILSAAKALAKTGKGYSEQLHVLLCSAANHTKKHGDVRIITQVYDTVPMAVYRKGIDRWITAFSNLKYRPDAKGAKAYLKPKGEALQINLDAMVATPFWDLEANILDNRPILYDVDKRIAGVVRVLTKAALEGKIKAKTNEENKTARQHIEDLRAFCHKSLGIPIDDMTPDVDETPAVTKTEEGEIIETPAPSLVGSSGRRHKGRTVVEAKTAETQAA